MAGKGLSKQERSWVMYDVGNSAFVMLSTALIPIYFSSLAEPGSSVVVAWGYAETVASLILALLMPFLGSLADLQGNKKKFLVGFIGTGAVACAVEMALTMRAGDELVIDFAARPTSVALNGANASNLVKPGSTLAAGIEVGDFALTWSAKSGDAAMSVEPSIRERYTSA